MRAAYYFTSHIDKLKGEASERFARIMGALNPHSTVTRDGRQAANFNGSDIRLAVDDFKTILAEIRKIK